jgi:hypothetical protein
MDHREGDRPPRPDHAGTRKQSDAPGDGREVDVLVRPWLRLGEQLTPLIGESGFCALFGRALRLTNTRFAFLGRCDPSRPVEDLFASLTRTLNEAEPEHAGAANAALLDTFTAQLRALIGDALTKQLLHVATEGGVGQKHEQERK